MVSCALLGALLRMGGPGPPYKGLRDGRAQIVLAFQPESDGIRLGRIGQEFQILREGEGACAYDLFPRFDFKAMYGIQHYFPRRTGAFESTGRHAYTLIVQVELQPLAVSTNGANPSGKWVFSQDHIAFVYVDVQVSCAIDVQPLSCLPITVAGPASILSR